MRARRSARRAVVEEQHARPRRSRAPSERLEQQAEERLELELALDRARDAVQHRELVQELVALAVERVDLDRAAQREPQLVGLPRLRDVAVDRAVVDRAARASRRRRTR